MQTQVQVQISNIGHTIGTVGWLANQSIKISIGHTKKGFLACWLRVGEKSELVSARNADFSIPCWEDCHGMPCVGVVDVAVERRSDVGEAAAQDAFETPWTEAAWEKVEELIALAKDQFYAHVEKIEAEEAEEATKLSFSVTPQIQQAAA